MMQMKDPRKLLKTYGLAPRRSLGQNFLVDSKAPERIVSGADVSSEDVVLEVGAGLGTLTAPLVDQAGRVLAVETDPKLVSVLEDQFGSYENVQIIHGDILDLDPLELLGLDVPEDARPLWGGLQPHYLVVANLPYYITAAVIRHLMESSVRPARMVLTVQREVAQRIVAKPGDMNMLAISVQFYGTPRVLFRLKRGAFYPVPAVESAVVRVDLHEDPPVEDDHVDTFFRVARAGFAQRRKQLRNTLSATLHLAPTAVAEALDAVDVDPTRRAETLSLLEWGRVVRALSPTLKGGS